MGCITNDALLLMLRKLCHLVRLLPIIFLYWRQADGDIETPHIIGDTKKEANLPDSVDKKDHQARVTHKEGTWQRVVRTCLTSSLSQPRKQVHEPCLVRSVSGSRRFQL